MVHDLNEKETLNRFQDEGVSLSRSMSVHFSVEENLTTGYAWTLEKAGPCEGFVSVSESYDAPQFDDGLEVAGASGTKYFTFTGQKTGKCTWRAAYARPWEFDWENRVNNNVQMLEIPITVDNL